MQRLFYSKKQEITNKKLGNKVKVNLDPDIKANVADKKDNGSLKEFFQDNLVPNKYFKGHFKEDYGSTKLNQGYLVSCWTEGSSIWK